MSQQGICSRRQAEQHITNGLVQVNGETAHLGQVIDPDNDVISYASILQDKTYLYFKYNKPTDIVTSCPQVGEQSIMDVLELPEGVVPIGRLDKDTTGLILLTNNTQLQTYLMDPKASKEKEYLVTTKNHIDNTSLQQLEQGVQILGTLSKVAKTKRISDNIFTLTITEGKNRQVRRMCRAIGHQVIKLKRVRIGEIQLAKLPLGEYSPLSPEEQSRCEALLPT